MTRLECIKEIVTSQKFFIEVFYHQTTFVTLLLDVFIFYLQPIAFAFVFLYYQNIGEPYLEQMYKVHEALMTIFFISVYITLAGLVYQMIMAFISCWDVLKTRYTDFEQDILYKCYDHMGIPLYTCLNKVDILLCHIDCYSLRCSMYGRSNKDDCYFELSKK